MPKITVIRPKPKPFDFDWQEIWECRDLIYYLTWRDIKVRYKQTVLGLLWIVLQPLASTGLFTLVFGSFAKIPSDNIPYPIFVYIGLIFWNFFSNTLTNASNSIIFNDNILKKVYFPRIIAPLSATISCLIDQIPVLLILFILLLLFRVKMTLLALVLTPVLFFLVFLAGLGLGAFFAPINAKYRDIRNVLPYFIQLCLFATPVIYPSSLFGGTSKVLRMFNPVAESIEVYRSLLFHTRPIEWSVLFMSFAVTIVVFLFSVYYFRRSEESFIDVL